MRLLDMVSHFYDGRARCQRQTLRLLDSLPDEVQKDIGWRWRPRRRGQPKARPLGFPGQ